MLFKLKNLDNSSQIFIISISLTFQQYISLNKSLFLPQYVVKMLMFMIYDVPRATGFKQCCRISIFTRKLKYLKLPTDGGMGHTFEI